MDANRHSQEWIKQSQYDIDTAQAMLNAGRYVYCIFMCHLSIEKALKAVFIKKLSEIPPKTHNLVYLVQRCNLGLSEEIRNLIENLNDVSIPTRYPEQLDKLLSEYNKERTQVILDKSNEVIKWLKQEL